MIKLTTRNGNPIWFAPEHITAVELVLKDDERTWLYTTETDEPAIVTESPEEVVRKMLEWQIKTNRVQALAQKWAQVDDEKKFCWSVINWNNGKALFTNLPD